MIVLLHKHSQITRQVATSFYFRRARRIVPVYLCTIALSLLSAIAVLCRFDYSKMMQDLRPALYFWTNMDVLLAKDDYFKQVSRYLSWVEILCKTEFVAIFQTFEFSWHQPNSFFTLGHWLSKFNSTFASH